MCPDGVPRAPVLRYRLEFRAEAPGDGNPVSERSTPPVHTRSHVDYIRAGGCKRILELGVVYKAGRGRPTVLDTWVTNGRPHWDESQQEWNKL